MSRQGVVQVDGSRLVRDRDHADAELRDLRGERRDISTPCRQG